MILLSTSRAVEEAYSTESRMLVQIVPSLKFDAMASYRVSIAMPGIYNAFAKPDKGASRKL